jgi:hypothetical protein
MLSRRPPFLDWSVWIVCVSNGCVSCQHTFAPSPLPRPQRGRGRGGGGEGEGALAVLYSTGAELDATRFRRVSVHLRPGS